MNDAPQKLTRLVLVDRSSVLNIQPELLGQDRLKTDLPAFTQALIAKQPRQTIRSTTTPVSPQLSLSWQRTQDIPLHLRQPLARVPELLHRDAALVEHRPIQAAHPAFWFAEVIEDSPPLDLPASTAEQHDRQVGRVMATGQHARTIQQHRVIECRSFPFLDRIQLPRDVAELLDEELVDLQPIRRVRVRQQVVDHVIDAEMRETQRTVVVVELQRADARRVSLKTEDHDVAH